MDIDIAGKGGKIGDLQAAFIPDGEIHEFSSSDKNSFIVLDIKTDHFLELDKGNVVLDHFTKRLFFTIDARLQHLVNYASMEQSRTAQVSFAWAQLFIAHTIRRLSETSTVPPQPLSRACANIDLNLASSLSVTQIARHSGVSERSLLTLFRSNLQTTPHAYVMQRRAKKALMLLESTSKSIEEIAILSGYTDQSALTRSLRTLHGTTPAKHRKCHYQTG